MMTNMEQICKSVAAAGETFVRDSLMMLRNSYASGRGSLADGIV